MEESAQLALWQDMRVETGKLIAKNGVQMEILDMRTISGEEEGLYAFIAVNFLTGTVTHTLEKLRSLSGVVDLGGASTQVALPLREFRSGESVDTAAIFIRSFLGYGTQQFRENNKEALGSVCEFGEGNAQKCGDVMKSIFDKELGAGVAFPKSDVDSIRSRLEVTPTVYDTLKHSA